MFYFERKKICSTFIAFICGHLPNVTFIFFLSRFLNCFFFFFGEVSAIVRKCSTLGVAGALNCPQYVPTWTDYTNNLIQQPDKR